MALKKFLLFLTAALVWLPAVQSQQIRSLEFRDQEIRDVLLILAKQNGVSIIPDETVEGKASYVFSQMDFDQALKIFLDSYRLSYTLKNGVYYVSKIRSDYSASSGILSVEAQDVPLRTLIRSLMTTTGRTILHDNMPNDPFSLKLVQGTLDDALKILTAKYPDYLVDRQESFHYLRKRTSETAAPRPGAGSGRYIRREGDLYSLNAPRVRFRDLLLEHFALGKQEFILLLEKDLVLENLYISGKSFDELLKIILLQANGDFSVSQGVYYITEVQRKDLLRRYLTNIILPLQYISTGDLVKLLPASLNSGSQMRVDEKSNKVILSGTLEEITPLLDFIKQADQPMAGLQAFRMDLNFMKAEEVLPLLPQEFSSFGPLVLPGSRSFLIVMPPARKAALEGLLGVIDRPASSFPFRLKYIKAEELAAALPPSVAEANLVKTNQPVQMFFRGTETQFRRFQGDLARLDVPKPQLRYEILVLQFTDTDSLSTEPTYSVTTTSDPASMAATGLFTELLKLNFDVISGLGYKFSAGLSAKLNNRDAKVLADTTLNVLSGEKVSFQNTETTRVKDTSTETDPTTGKQVVTNIVRELASGLILNLDGWISGDRMITMKVDAVLSQKVDSGSGDGALPATSENKINTLVRTQSGKPIVIGGLKREDLNMEVTKVPFLGDIPLLGLLFQKRTETYKTTEYAIYIVPHLEYALSEEDNLPERIHTLYTQLKAPL